MLNFSNCAHSLNILKNYYVLVKGLCKILSDQPLKLIYIIRELKLLHAYTLHLGGVLDPPFPGDPSPIIFPPPSLTLATFFQNYCVLS